MFLKKIPIKSLVSHPTEEYTSFVNQNYKTKQLSSNKYFHFIQYNETQIINKLYLDFGMLE